MSNLHGSAGFSVLNDPRLPSYNAPLPECEGVGHLRSVLTNAVQMYGVRAILTLLRSIIGEEWVKAREGRHNNRAQFLWWANAHLHNTQTALHCAEQECEGER
jgi:hypothetical protein